MTGSAFITHNDTWSCSNEVALGLYHTPIKTDDGLLLKETKTLTIQGIFHATAPPKIGDKCEFVILNDELGKHSYSAEVKAIGELQTILNIFDKTDRITEILSNITIKMKNHGN